VIHDDGDSLDSLTRLFEASGFDVIAAVTAYRAEAHLEGDRPIDVVVAPWDTAHPVGGDVYRWTLQRRYDLRDQFVFLATEVPAEFDRVVAGRCLAVSPTLPAEVVRVAVATHRRRENLDLMRDAAFTVPDHDKPTLLVADDEPVLLMVMADLFAEAGFTVTTVESGNAAIARLDFQDFDALVVDWNMDDGSGADLFRWIANRKPWLASRVVFLSGEEGVDLSVVAPGRPLFRKGDNSAAMLAVLHEIVREARADEPTVVE